MTTSQTCSDTPGATAATVDAGADATSVAGSPRATLLAALLGFFVVTLDAVIVNVALPRIRSELGGGIGGLQWVVDGYTLSFAALLLSAGSLSDRVGAKRAFGLGLVTFVLASLACASAPGIGVLVGIRFAQGAAAAVIMPSSMALIGQAYPDPRRRAHAVAIWAMGGAVASTSGPLLGGLLTMVSWRWIFVVNLPVGAVAVLLLTGASRSEHHRVPFDWPGQVTGAVAMAAFTYGAITAGDAGFDDPRVLTALALAAAALAAFLALQRRVPHPMLPLDLFRSRTVSAAVVIGFAFMVGYYGLPFVMSLFLQQQRGLSPVATGVAFLPMMLVGLVLTPLVPRVTGRLGARRVVVTGLGLMMLGLAALAVLPHTVPVAVFGGLMVLVGLGGPTIAPPITAVLLDAVPASRAGTASGVLNTSRQLGGALAVAVFGALLAGPHFSTGMRLSLLLAALVAAAAAAAGALALPARSGGRTHVGSRHHSHLQRTTVRSPQP